jgi:DNA-binding beta-propeller fold protein YncE
LFPDSKKALHRFYPFIFQNSERNMRYYLIFLFILFIACQQQHSKSPSVVLAGNKSDSAILLPNGWKLTPAGHSIPLGDLPLNMIFSHDGHFLFATNNGYSHPTITVVSLDSQKVVQTLKIPDAWLGLAISPDGKMLYVSGGNRNRIYELNFENGKLSWRDSIVLDEPWPKKMDLAGISISKNGKTLYAVSRENNTFYAIDISSKKITLQIPLPAEAYTCLPSHDGKNVFISVWGKSEVLDFNTTSKTMIDSFRTGNHPNAMALTKNDQVLYVSNANDNTVGIIDLAHKKFNDVINAAVHPTDLAGSTPNAICLSNDERFLCIANADNNCLALMDVSNPHHTKSAGFIPTGWYPTAVLSDSSHIYVANGKGNISFSNVHGPVPGKTDTSLKVQYIGRLLIGTLSVIPFPNAAQLNFYTKEVFQNTRFQNPDSTKSAAWTSNNPVPNDQKNSSSIKHVFYIIKENRTYDQMLGDLPQGNGDSSLCLFPEKISPNQHAIASQFVLLDNFYVDAEVSADGHNWSMAGYATDYTEKTWPASYADRGGDYEYEGAREIVKPSNGYIWDYCARNNVSYRTYGEFADLGKASIPVLQNHCPNDYPNFDLSIYDTTRERLWENDFDSLLKINAVPQFQTIRFGNDHTGGAKAGFHTPTACVADNDLAVGKFVDHLSHSSIWKESVVFILEDDAQNGPDHVDAHRSTVYVAGGFVKKNFVDHTMYSTSSVLHTIELILHLPPMSQYDASATLMFNCFDTESNHSAYQFIPNKIPLDTRNPPHTKLAALSSGMDLKEEDRVPDDLFSEIIWKAVKGENAEMPSIHHAAFVFCRPDNDD